MRTHTLAALRGRSALRRDACCYRSLNLEVLTPRMNVHVFIVTAQEIGSGGASGWLLPPNLRDLKHCCGSTRRGRCCFASRRRYHARNVLARVRCR